MGDAAKFRVWAKPEQYLHFGGFAHFERQSSKLASPTDPNGPSRPPSPARFVTSSSRVPASDDKARVAREASVDRLPYSEPPTCILVSGTLPVRVVTPPHQDRHQQLAGPQLSPIATVSVASFSPKASPPTSPPRQMKSRSQPNMVTFDKPVPFSHVATATGSNARGYGADPALQTLTASFGSSKMLPPLQAASGAQYGRRVDLRDKSTLHHLVLKEHRSKVAAQQRMMLKELSLGHPDLTDGWTEAPPPVEDVTPPWVLSPVQLHKEYKYTRPSTEGPMTTSMRQDQMEKLGPRYTRSAGGEFTVEDSRVLHAIHGQLAGCVPFGESTMEKVDIRMRNPLALPGAAGGLASFNLTSPVLQQSLQQWHDFAAKPLQASPATVDFGTLRVGVTYSYVLKICNQGIVSKRYRVVGASVDEDSSPSTIVVRYASLRLAAGMSAPLRVVLAAGEPGRVQGRVRVATEDDDFCIPITALVLSSDSFAAAYEKAEAERQERANKGRVPPRVQPAKSKSTAPAYLIPDVTHPAVRVVGSGPDLIMSAQVTQDSLTLGGPATTATATGSSVTE